MKIKKLNLESFKSVIDVVSTEELAAIKGGYNGSDCVINCFNYIDGSNDNYYAYNRYAMAYLGYDGTGGINYDDFSQLASVGGMTVTDLQTPGGSGIGLTSSGLTTSGQRVMMTFDGGVSGSNHAVVVTGVGYDSYGNAVLNYFDPSTNTYGSRQSGQYVGLFAVGY